MALLSTKSSLGFTGDILGLYKDNGKQRIYWGYIRIMENKMETAVMRFGV